MSKTIDELTYEVAQLCKDTGETPERIIYNLIMEETTKSNFKINVRGSSLINFSANPLHFAIQQFLKVSYGANQNTIVGNAVHDAADYGYKYKMAMKKLPRLGKCVSVIYKSVKDGFQKIKPDLREKYTQKELLKEAIKLFKVYYSTIMPNREVVESEFNFIEEVPVEMVSNPINLSKIKLSGTLDRIYRIENGKLVLNDLKTSGKRISGGVEYSEELKSLTDEYKEIKEKLEKLVKESNKLASLKEKLAIKKGEYTETIQELSLKVVSNINLLKGQLKEDEEKLTIAQNENKSTAAIEKRIEKTTAQITENEALSKTYNLDSKIETLFLNEKVEATTRSVTKLEKIISEVLDFEKEIQTFSGVEKGIEQTTQELDEKYLEIEPFKKEYEREKHLADTRAAKKQYGLQLAFYAIMYMVIHNVKIDKLSVEIIVKTNNPYVQHFEWDLDEKLIVKASERIQTVIKAVEAVLNGLDPIILFPINELSYIGDDTNNLLDEIEAIVESV